MYELSQVMLWLSNPLWEKATPADGTAPGMDLRKASTLMCACFFTYQTDLTAVKSC